MRRRDFIAILGGAAVGWPLAARAQQPAMPVIGFLGSASFEPFAHLVKAFRQGLGEAGYVEGRNVAIEFRWAENQYDRLPAMAAELVDHTDIQLRDVEAAAQAAGRQLVIVYAATERDFDAAFATLVEQRVDALVVTADPFFNNQHAKLVALLARHAMPAIYQWREFAAAGGLVSYGPSLVDVYRQVGIYAGRILKGEKPADLPVMRPTKFDFVVNLRTAKALGLAVPPTLLGLADEVIE